MPPFTRCSTHRSIAVVGATERAQYGGRFLRAALQAGDRVRVYPVNPRYDELLGQKCYSSVLDLPEAPDAVGIIVPYNRVIPVLRESAERGAGSGIVISAGFSERGVNERRELQAELGEVARETGVRISGPNCLGLANIKDDILGVFVVTIGGSRAKERQHRPRLPERRVRVRSVPFEGSRTGGGLLLHCFHRKRG